MELAREFHERIQNSVKELQGRVDLIKELVKQDAERVMGFVRTVQEFRRMRLWRDLGYSSWSDYKRRTGLDEVLRAIKVVRADLVRGSWSVRFVMNGLRDGWISEDEVKAVGMSKASLLVRLFKRLKIEDEELRKQWVEFACGQTYVDLGKIVHDAIVRRDPNLPAVLPRTIFATEAQWGIFDQAYEVYQRQAGDLAYIGRFIELAAVSYMNDAVTPEAGDEIAVAVSAVMRWVDVIKNSLNREQAREALAGLAIHIASILKSWAAGGG